MELDPKNARSLERLFLAALAGAALASVLRPPTTVVVSPGTPPKCASAPPATRPASPLEYRERVRDFTVQLEQDGVVRPARGEHVALAAAPFVLVFHLDAPGELLVNASFARDTFDLVHGDGALLDSPAFRFGSSMAEGDFNADGALWPAPDRHHAWYYRNPHEHRFDSVEPEGDGLLARRRVDAIEVPRDDGPPVRMEFPSLRGRTLHLVIVTAEGARERRRVPLALDFQ